MGTVAGAGLTGRGSGLAVGYLPSSGEGVELVAKAT
jgi:hypothetical protein